MRQNVSLLLAVFLALIGACAGRQVRTGMSGLPSFQEQPIQARSAVPAEKAPASIPATEPAAVPAPEAEKAVATPAAPNAGADLRLAIQRQIDALCALLSDPNAPDSPCADQANRTRSAVSAANASPPVPETKKALVAPVIPKADAGPKPDVRRRAAPRTENRRASALPAPPAAAVDPNQPLQAVNRPAPSGVAAASDPARKDVLAATSTPASAPDAPQGKDAEVLILEGAVVALLLGLLFLSVLVRRYAKRFRRLLRPYTGLPDGAVIVHEIRGGKVRRTDAIINGVPPKDPIIDPVTYASKGKPAFDQSDAHGPADAGLTARRSKPQQIVDPAAPTSGPPPTLTPSDPNSSATVIVDPDLLSVPASTATPAAVPIPADRSGPPASPLLPSIIAAGTGNT